MLPVATSATAATPRADRPLPMTFEPNQGQAETAVRFLARGRGYGLFLTPTETVLVLAPAVPTRSSPAPRPEQAVVRMRLVGADPGATIAGVEPLPGRSHYLLGPSDHWRRSVPSFARVRYNDVYPGVSLVFYGNERELEYDFIVAPGADPAAVTLAFEGADSVRMDGDGDLVLTTRVGDLRLRRPVIYQEVEGGRHPVEGGYVLDGNRVRFRVTGWDASRPLVIDPVLGYSTFLGGSSNDQGFGVAVDSAGNAYVTGSTISSNFPISAAAAQPTRQGVTDAFVTKIDPSGALVYSTFLGGNGDDAGHAIAVDDTFNAYVAGTTSSTTFPVQGAFQSTLRGGTDAFVTKLDPSGSTLVYSTYLGSNTDDAANGIALDAFGNAYVTGATASSGFPNNGAVTCLGTKSTGSDAFVLRLDVSGATVDYCRFIGGSGIDVGQGIAADAAGNVWVVGATTSSNLPVLAALQPTLGGRTDGFVGKLDPTGVLVYLTYLGGRGDDLALAVAVDGPGNAYVTGSTDSPDFPTLSPFQASSGGGDDAFVAKLNAAGSALVFSTFLGGIGDDAGNGIAVHPGDSSVFVVGSTKSVDFPMASAIQPGLAGRLDAFVTRLNPAGSALVASTYLGGAGDDVAQAVAVDADGVVYVTGFTNSTAFPTAATPIQNAAGLLDAFVSQIVEAGIIQFTVAGYQVSETAGTATISVQRTGDTSSAATVHFATSDGSATAGADYTAVSGTLTFLAGQITRTFTVPILADVLCDGDETVNLTLSSPGGGSVLGRRSAAVLTILDPASCINFSDAAYHVGENHGPALITVARSGAATGTVTVRFATADDSAIQPGDYMAVNRILTFGPGVRSVTVPITIVNDAIIEGPESLNLVLSAVTGPATLGVRDTATLQILDADIGGVIQFASAVYTVSEGPVSATITVVRTGSTAGGATVDYSTSDGSATAPGDYTTTTGTLTFGVGQTSLTFAVPIADDGLAEGVETVNLTLSNPGPNATTSLGPRTTAILRIVDSELSLRFSATSYTVRESAGAATITVELTGVNATTVTVHWAASDDTALAGSDYGTRGSLTPPSGTLVFPPGGTPTTVRTRTFTVPILQDSLIEVTETVTLTLTLPVGATFVPGGDVATLSITDDDVGGTIQFAAATYTVVENAGPASIVVSRTGSAAGGATVDFATSNGTATAGADYTATTGTLTFGVGQTSLTFNVTITDDGVAEGVETVNLTLSNPGPNVTTKLGARTTAVLRIVDNELSLGFSAAAYSVRENVGAATITVELIGVNVTPVTVAWATSDGTALAGSDYGTRGSPAPPAGVLTFAAGGTSPMVRTRTFTVPILQDSILEATETVNLTLSGPVGATIVAGRDTAVLSILDDDIGGTIQFTAATYTVVEGAGPATIAVSRSGGAAGGATVDFATSNGTATAGADYTTTTGTLTFGVGQTSLTFAVPIADDAVADGVETVNLTLSNPGPNATTTLGLRTTAVLRIVDNELTVAFATPTYSARESAGVATIAVELTGVNVTPVTVAWATGNVTAQAGSDYGTRGSATAPSGVLTFPAGGTPATVRTRTFAVPILQDTIVEGTETVQLTLTGPVGAQLVPGRDMAMLLILDDDVGGVVQFSAALFNATECATLPCNATLTVSRTGGAASGVTVDFATADGTATAVSDYVATTGTITFAAGQASQVIHIPLQIELGAQATKSFSVIVSNPTSGATLGARTTAEVRVTDPR